MIAKDFKDFSQEAAAGSEYSETARSHFLWYGEGSP